MNETRKVKDKARERSKHCGEYVAWIGDRIVAHGKNLKGVVQEAEKQKGKPIIDKVGTEGIRVV